MTYATPQDLAARFGADEALDLAGTGEARIDAALADAAAEIDAALAAAYRLPLGDGDGSRGTRAEDESRGTRGGRTWPRLVAIACDLARARLYDDVSSDEVSARADRARATLVRLAAGEEALLDAAGRPLSRRDRAAGKGPTPSMSPDSLAGL